MAANVSDHANFRLAGRAGKKAKHHAGKFLSKLWHEGREADLIDFILFDTHRRSQCRYRVTVRHGMTYLVVRDRCSGVFVTLIKEKF